ncbi:hypothetical protein PHYBLDRAFT_60852 [Phycomyces blakesleeanus NRRL 1555(-)]|uniref:Uncharacterized protein n=1 Tax=Phycomyces blakesleeanus (strain ATCC 8743b / DSM 1359 / FGSC 10004 / NBRC 33097 / NRRL 1555) TaxID=763407 RepID=A0A162US73_PHYB8|nr:hypothetical protein PHYBLDRAFT_60852 [Phycomyces blakesleeanus NRRL 1555(-)]OAD77732.1 hypothetical protein PHYBLDRAFT_60852 [Phycomyces blakesleeanus NRRL 1555(-)]|eukprot:XP_018295772.1 hypothetical protein PHYBLDRAFT_60852 [Phycomyces blakesleeanus NRRL 1555(-)]
MTPSSLSPHYAAQSPSGRKPDLVAKEVLEWWQTNGKHPFIQPHISLPSNVGANSPENLPLGDKVQLIRLPVASPSAVKEFSQVSSEEPAHLTTGGGSFNSRLSFIEMRFPKGISDYYQIFRDNSPEHTKYSQPEFRKSFV